ncbi:TetR/AcrR family transcriptional regulator [Larkinella soli]|uniref:TetR/AcrR family transcriptional regulator n=1 Tax=Larkinella soli TaxID=1770527 RepID=UPI000FFC5BE6|nr:TetR/AcrR family transcriptional regulator [Larkinella soli]
MPVQKVTREEILQKAMRVFKRQGYHRTTMDDLARACGLLKGSFYHYFSSKEVLMKEVLRYVNDFNEKHVFAVAYEESLSPEERLGQLLDRLFRGVMTSEGGCLMGNTVLETSLVTTEFKEPLQQHFTNFTRAVGHIYESVFPAEKAFRLAEHLAIEIEGSIMLVRLGGHEYLMQDCRDRALERLRNGREPGPSGS